MTLKVSVIIPTYNRKKVLQNTLDMLLEQDYGDYEILVISQKQQVDIKSHPKIRRFHLPKPNLPMARNEGIKHAVGSVILFLDDDIIPVPDLISRHVEALEMGYGAVVGKVVDERGPGTRDKVIHYDERTGEYVTDFGKDQAQETLSLAGGNSSYRKEIFDKLQYDTFFNLTAHWEEVDLAFRMRKLGYKIYFEPRAKIIHLMVADGGCRAMNKWLYYYSQYKNSTLMYLKHCRLINLPFYLKFQKNFLEYQSRLPGGKHSVAVVSCSLFGIFFGFLFYLIEVIFFRSRLALAKW